MSQTMTEHQTHMLSYNALIPQTRA